MLRDEMLTLVLCHKPKCHLKQHDDNSGSNREWQMALQKTGYRKVRSGLTISRRDSDYMTATYSGIDPELRRLSRAGAFGVDGTRWEHAVDSTAAPVGHGYDERHSHRSRETRWRRARVERQASTPCQRQCLRSGHKPCIPRTLNA